ncbi:MAG: hypothetical protein V1682_06010 [Candidatus Omnitrophota bacterium]
MTSKTIKLCVGFFLAAVLFVPTQAFSQEKSGTEQSVSSEKVEISSENIEKTLPSYNANLKKIIEEVERNIARIDGELKKREAVKRNEDREAEVREYFEAGNKLRDEGKFEEAKAEWEKALDITRDPEMRGYIKQSEAKARKEEKARRDAERLAREAK